MLTLGPQDREPEEQKGLPMGARPYKGFFISVEAVSQPNNSSRRINPLARISVEEGGKPLTSLHCPSEFSTYYEAETYCFQMAERWIDNYTLQEKSGGCDMFD